MGARVSAKLGRVLGRRVCAAHARQQTGRTSGRGRAVQEHQRSVLRRFAAAALWKRRRRRLPRNCFSETRRQDGRVTRPAVINGSAEDVELLASCAKRGAILERPTAPAGAGRPRCSYRWGLCPKADRAELDARRGPPREGGAIDEARSIYEALLDDQYDWASHELRDVQPTLERRTTRYGNSTPWRTRGRSTAGLDCFIIGDEAFKDRILHTLKRFLAVALRRPRDVAATRPITPIDRGGCPETSFIVVHAPVSA